MAEKPDYKPKGYPNVMPYLLMRDAGGLVEFIRKVFNGIQKERMVGPDGRVTHAEMVIGDSIVMMGDMPGPHDHMPAMMYVYVEDVDATYARALAAGATSIRGLTDEFYGDRDAGVQDPFGNQWWIATHVEDITPEEMQRRMKDNQMA